MAKKIAYILGSFPGGEPPFIINEIKELIKEGLDILVFPVHKVNGGDRKVDSRGIKAIYADPIFSLKIIMAHLYFIFRSPFEYFSLLIKNKIFGGKKIFWEGVYYAKVIDGLQIKHIHAHFAWNSTDCARMVKRLTGIPFSFTAHARDIYVETDYFKEKLEDAKFVITCVQHNKDYMVRHYGDEFEDKINVVYHGVDIDKFNPQDRQEKSKIDILSITQALSEKKGLDYLIEAIFLLKNRGFSVNCQIIGKGKNSSRLDDLVNDLGVRDYIKLVKPLRQEKLVEFYQNSKIFVLPCIIARDGDRDGIPNVLAEAMAMEIPVISTKLPNIAELIEDGKDGILVPERNARVLADTIEKLLSDAGKRKKMEKNAREKVTKEFDAKEHIKKLAALFDKLIDKF